MRTEQQMFDLILTTAKEDERIVAVYMNGSRTNPNVPKDIFQDYDIVYVVRETRTFRDDPDWIKRFGKILFMQFPEENDFYPNDRENSYGWLMQFEDGNRLDLHVETIEHTLAHIKEDGLCRILLDKEGILPKLPESTDAQYWVKRPSQEEVAFCCNEFWWCLDNVAKGLWREEIPYVQDMLNYVIRPQLVTLLSWKVGIQTEFSCSVGKSGKYLPRWLTKEEWQQFLATYAGGKVLELWEAVKIMCQLFDRTARSVCEALHYSYDEKEAEACMGFLERVHRLPKDAKEI